MLISSMIVKTRPGKAGAVLPMLEKIPRVSTYGIHRGNNIIVVAESHDLKQLENLTAFILDTMEDVLGVFPTYLNFEEEVAGPQAQGKDHAEST
ncbi:MAG: hypothetical protein D6814_14540 [Calditrichaeota bacterium]|nr:MAG: hypothetical protein D6814_14540 [Calditrichota bacterium]